MPGHEADAFGKGHSEPQCERESGGLKRERETTFGRGCESLDECL